MDKEVNKNFCNKISSLFTKHPKANNMTYIKHFIRAVNLSLNMGLGSTLLFIHALFPFLFESAGSNIIIKLNKEINKKDEEEKQN
jgi:hypothetical protein